MAGEKRSQETEAGQRTENIVLVDIEGTTTSISFVKDTLFPHVRKHLKDYIEKNWENAEFKADFEKLKDQAKKDETDKVDGFIAITSCTPEEEKETLLKNILWQMDNDRKTGALKQLQGHIWREAYKSGAVRGHVYDDVPKAFEAWTASNKKIYIYSSGSVEAQKLLFAHSMHGDLLKYFTDYFDTEIGSKKDAVSYKSIISKLSVEPNQVLFLTDVPKEAEAAVEAGLSAILVVREGNVALSIEEKVSFPTIQSFLDITFQTSVKRQKVEEPAPLSTPKEKEAKIEDSTNSEEPDDVEMTDLTNKSPEKKVQSEELKSIEAPTDSIEVVQPSTASTKFPETADEEPSTTVKVDEVVKMEVEKREASELPQKEESVVKPVKEATQLPVDTEILLNPANPEVKPDESKPEHDVTKVELEVTKAEPKITKVEHDVKGSEVAEKLTTEKAPEESLKVDEEVKDEALEKPELVHEKPEKPQRIIEEVVQTDEKLVEAKEKIEKIEEKVEKKNGEEVKQNGDSKVNDSIQEPKGIQTNGNSKKEDTIKEPEEKEIMNDIKEVKEVKEIDVKKTEPEEETKEKSAEKKVNGNAESDKSHRNCNDMSETTKNGESSDEKDTMKVTKVVDSIVDGVIEPEAPPVAVVAATS